MPWTVSLLVYFAIAALLALAGKRLGRSVGVVGTIPFVVTLVVAVASAGEATSSGIIERIEWIPTLDVSLDLTIDTLRLTLSTLVAGIGLLIAGSSAGADSAPTEAAETTVP